MANQMEVKVVCKSCKARFILINTFSNSMPYICLKCTFAKEKHIEDKCKK